MSELELNRLRKRLREPCKIGWSELVDLPVLGLHNFHAKIDTGAATSSLHAVGIRIFERGGEEWASFSIPKSPRHDAKFCEARIVAKRKIKSSNGHSDQRYVIETPMKMGPLTWMGQLTLANRQSMAFPILIGRRALKRGFLVDCSKRWLLGAPQPRSPRPIPPRQK